MRFQPELKYELMSCENLRYTCTHLLEPKVPDDPRNGEAHIHSCYEVYINISGDVSFLVNNHVYPVKHGDMIITRPEDLHLCIFNAPCLHEHVCLWLDAPATSPLVSFCHCPDFQHLIPVEDDVFAHFLTLIHRLADPDSADTSILLRTAALCEILDYPQRHLAAGSQSPTLLPEEMQHILTYINNHFCQIRYIKEIYDQFYISPATLNRRFRKYVHLSPKEFLESKKLAYAKKLLVDGYTVTEACMHSGFSDSSHFIAVFKDKFGVTPHVYKRSISLHA